jgi:type IV secretion system protein VirB2
VCVDANRRIFGTLFVLMVCAVPEAALAQASPFQTGATALQINALAIATPVAILVVMVLGLMAMSNRIAWGWVIGSIVGVAILFGAPQVVGWIRGMFGV